MYESSVLLETIDAEYTAFEAKGPAKVPLTQALRKGVRTFFGFFEDEELAALLVIPREREDMTYICSNTSDEGFGAVSQDRSGQLRSQ